VGTVEVSFSWVEMVRGDPNPKLYAETEAGGAHIMGRMGDTRKAAVDNLIQQLREVGLTGRLKLLPLPPEPRDRD